MFLKIQSLSVQGLKVSRVDVEVDVGRGLPGMVVVGLPDKAIMESRDRVRTALLHTDMPYPRNRITVNLAPGDLRKEGPLYDLPIALGVIGCTELIKIKRDLAKHWVVGELALDGRLRPVHGVLPMAEIVHREGGNFVIPAANYAEASLVDGLDAVPVAGLDELLAYFSGEAGADELRSRHAVSSHRAVNPGPGARDFGEVKGQLQAKRALTIAAAGGHNVLMLGPPGSGKSMLAERMPGILPEMSPDEALEVTNIYSVAGRLSHDMPLVRDRPFRSPHHTISDAALIGGGADARPGEISLAHRGVLFMDELTEFKRGTLEVLRQPLESGSIQIGRARQVCDYPAQFLLIAAMNPCPCGYYGSRVRSCRCSPGQIEKYLGRLSGPLLDRIDIHLEVSDQPPEQLRRSSAPGPGSGELRSAVHKAVALQERRFADSPLRRNGEMRGAMVERHCALGRDSEEFLIAGMREMGLSARAFHKVLVVARTIADLAGAETISLDHVAEAINYRTLDRKLFD